MEKPKDLKLKVIDKEWVSDQVVKIDFETQDIEKFAFKPGQHINMRVDGTVRPYTIFSDLKADNEISIVVSAAHEGVGANYLRDLEIGEIADVMGPVGRLTLADEHKKNIVFLATGTGLVPFITMLYKLAKEDCKSNIKLYFGVRDRADIFFRDELEKATDYLENFDYEICLSDPKKKWEECNGYVNENFEIDDSGNTRYYICGVPSMVSDINKLLLDNGVSEDNIIK